MTPGENDLVAIAKHYGRDPKVFAIGMFDAVIMLKALATVLEMTEPMLKKILPFTVWKSILRYKMRCCIASSTTSRLKDKQPKVSLGPQSKRSRLRDLGPEGALHGGPSFGAASSLARSVADLCAIAKRIESKGCDSPHPGINLDTATPTGKLMLNVLARVRPIRTRGYA